MKSDFHFHFYSRIFIMLILAISVLAIQRSVPSSAEILSYPYKVTGWAWNDKSRWISLNCYNDFESPGEYISTCATGNYGLQINADGTVTGCIWGGNNLSGGISPVGWICFNEYADPGDRVTPSDFGVTTSSDPNFPNALSSATFASILSLENWLCVGGAYDGQRCSPNSTACSGGGGVCTFTDNQRWKLGFPLFKSVPSYAQDYPSADDPLKGCFNCYERIVYKCESNTNDWDPECDPNNNACPLVGVAPNQYQDPCVAVDVEKKCDNCLDYSYYPGRCKDSYGNVSATMGCSSEFLAGNEDDCCHNNEDCNQAAGETCQPLMTLKVDYGVYYDEYNCTDELLNNSIHPCSWCPSDPPPGGVEITNGHCGYREVGELRSVIGAYNCTDCSIQDYDNRCTLNASSKNLNSCTTCDSAWYYPGVMIDNRHYGWSPDGNNDLDPTNPNPAPDDIAYMCGWAWNAWDDNSDGIADNGFYWFNFSPRVATSTKPYLFVDSGSIYSTKGLSNDYLPPTGYYNSSFLIESGGAITNFISSSTLSGLYQGELPYQTVINFLNLDASGKYSNALGSIDYDGLRTVVNATLGTNKYGSYVLTGVPITSIFSSLDDRDQVYYFNSATTTLNNAGSLLNYNFALGDDAWEVAAKTIVVNGNLVLGDNIDYATSSIPNIYSNFKNIPSTVWIIRGDLFIDADVSKVVGTFIVLGDDSGDCSFPSGGAPRSGCGRIVTCYDTNLGSPAATCRTSPLTISGTVFARYFDLGRTYIDTVNPVPSERFINDGRLQVNPPAGFVDFSNIIPRFSEQ